MRERELRIEQLRSQRLSQQSLSRRDATASGTEPHTNGEEPFSAQLDTITDLARRLGVEDQRARYPEEDFGDDIDSIVDTYGDDDDDLESFSDEPVAGDEGCYLDGVYYVYPKPAADRYRLD